VAAAQELEQLRPRHATLPIRGNRVEECVDLEWRGPQAQPQHRLTELAPVDH
jgi:hypothetical protein